MGLLPASSHSKSFEKLAVEDKLAPSRVAAKTTTKTHGGLMSTAYRFNCSNAPWEPRSADETPALLILKHETAHYADEFPVKRNPQFSFPLPIRSHCGNVEKDDISCMRVSNESSFISQPHPRSTAGHRSSGENPHNQRTHGDYKTSL